MNGQLARSYLTRYVMDVSPLYADYLDHVLSEMNDLPPLAHTTLGYIRDMSTKGKKIRGALVVLGYELAGGDDHAAIVDASIFMELFQDALLVHDDIMDHDRMRRGMPSMHVRFETYGQEQKFSSPQLPHYGESMAMCTGDILLNLAWDKLLTSTFPPEKILRASQVFARYFTRVGIGQMLDVTGALQKDVSETDIQTILTLKTAEYSCVLPLLVGAILGGLKETNKREVITQYAMGLGLVFQLHDDLLGSFGDTTETGKSTSSDIKEGKHTLLASYARSHATPEQRIVFDRVIGNKQATDADIEAVRTIMKQTGAYEYTLTTAMVHLRQAETCISTITSDDKLQDILRSFLDLMSQRTS